MRNAMVLVTVMTMAMTMGCAMEAQSPAVGEPEIEAAPQAATGQVSTVAGPVWYYLGTESCYDFFQRSCTWWLPSPQCPTAVAGQSCSSPGTLCDRVLPGNSFFHQFYCE